MILKVVYPDNSWMVGKQYPHWRLRYRETPGTHHLEILYTSGGLRHLVGQRVAVVIAHVRYFILEYEEGKANG